MTGNSTTSIKGGYSVGRGLVALNITSIKRLNSWSLLFTSFKTCFLDPKMFLFNKSFADHFNFCETNLISASRETEMRSRIVCKPGKERLIIYIWIVHYFVSLKWGRLRSRVITYVKIRLFILYVIVDSSIPTSSTEFLESRTSSK